MADDKGGLLKQASELERRYDWKGATDLYKSALELTPDEDPIGIGQMQEAIGYALFKWAMQSDNVGEFRRRLGESEMRYEGAKQSYSRVDAETSRPRVSRCNAMISYLMFWRLSEAVEKMKAINDAWSFAIDAIAGFQRSEVLEIARTYNNLFPCTPYSLALSDDLELRGKTLRDAVKYGEETVSMLDAVQDRDTLAKTLVYVAQALESLNIVSLVKRDEFHSNHRKATEYWRRAMELSEETSLVSKGSSDLLGGLPEVVWGDYEQILGKQLEYARITNDRVLIGTTIEESANYWLWEILSEEDPEVAKDCCDRILGEIEEASRELEKIGYVHPVAQLFWISSPVHWWYYSRLSNLETDLKKKHELLRRNLDYARQISEAAYKSGFRQIIDYGNWVLMRSMVELAKITDVESERRKFLKEALSCAEAGLKFFDATSPRFFWGGGQLRFVMGEIEQEIADATEDLESKKKLLDSSILHMEEGMSLYSEHVSWRQGSAVIDQAALASISESWSDLGRAFKRRYLVTGDRRSLIESATAFEKAADSAGQAGLPSRVAENLWGAAQAQDDLGDYVKASENFKKASSQYEEAAGKIKSLDVLYRDYAMYMKAWSEIEHAKHHHDRREPSIAAQFYTKAAEHHKSTVKWDFLSTDYFAWAQFEEAEDLSQRERNQESIEAFTKTASLLGDFRKMLQERIVRIDSPAEKHMVERLIGSVEHREEICKARIALEMARLLDKEGDLTRASERYGDASEMFAKIEKRLTSDQERKEAELVMKLANAWKMMVNAEANSSPEMYEEAARLFDAAKNLSPGDKAKNLAMGHSRLCMALGSGTRYADSGDSALHAAAVVNLESAAKFYLKADMKSAAEYVKASKLLIDSYSYVNRASIEENHEKKAKLYAMAEKVLDTSASSFGKAGQPGRKEQVLKIMAKVKEDRELAVSLAEVFLAPDIISTTMAFSSPAPMHETAVGLDSFEHADVQATLIAKPKELHVGQELSLEIELVNAGRSAAQLTKIEEIVPTGFVIVQEPERYRVEDSHINLRGRRLDALKTEDVKLVLKPTARGNFELKPRIMYLDESGKYRKCEPCSVKVSVREMGISGWIRGT